ncbi:hemin ABC transporter substrate-binding protein [soil metagenome]
MKLGIAFSVVSLLSLSTGSMTRWLLITFLGLAVACSKDSAKVDPAVASMDTSPPVRIVTAGGGVTETVFALGAGDRVVGVDTSSLFPDEAAARPKVGYQRALAAEGILSLHPTLFLGSAEAGPAAVLDQLRAAGVTVTILPEEPSIAGLKTRIDAIAAAVGADAKPLQKKLDGDLADAAALVAKATTHPKVVVVYARGPSMMQVFGAKTTTALMLTLAGAESAVTEFEASRPLTSEALAKAAPDYIVLPSRGLESLGGVDGFLAVPGVAQTPAGKAKHVVTIDDLMLLGLGPRTGLAIQELAKKLHPELASPQ